MLARTLMVQGTASSVGKSILVAALCRIFREQGIKVAPFKAQNMSLNSFVTPDGKEIGRAQAVQAEAAGIDPAVEMNPILLKPEGGGRSQIVMLGKPVGALKFGDNDDDRLSELRAVVADSLERLRRSYELIVIEGAGSPVEINLKQRDVVNMHVAKLAGAPVILVGDIDRGGVFAQFVGTMELLEPDERALVAAMLINKFHGDVALLQSGIDFIVQRVNTPMLGVIPFIERLRVADEDAVALDHRHRHTASAERLQIAVVRLPRISNFDDFQPLEYQAGASVRFVDTPHDLAEADLAILPGSKSTVADLNWMRANGFDRALIERATRALPILGVCGGYQMLGQTIEDPHGVESSERITTGLGLLAVRTCFARDKVTARVRARVNADSFMVDDAIGREIAAYEIHMGLMHPARDVAAPFQVISRNGEAISALEGAISENGAVVGTTLHGIFDNEWLCASMLRSLRRRRGLADPLVSAPFDRDAEYDRLAAIVRGSIDMALLQRLAGITR